MTMYIIMVIKYGHIIAKVETENYFHDMDYKLFKLFLEVCHFETWQKTKEVRKAYVHFKRTGEIIQFVPFDKRAWHAGESSYKNVKNCNDYSIGIELEGCEDISFEDIHHFVAN